MGKVTTNQLTAGMLSSNFNKKINEFIASDQAFTFMNSINGTLACWKKFLFDILAMVKQLGVLTFFMTLSSADLKWNELVLIINKLYKLDLLEENIKNLSYQDKCRLFNSNPVLVAKNFQYRVEVFFKKILLLMVHWGKLSIMHSAYNSKFVAHHVYIVFFGWSTHQFQIQTTRNSMLLLLIKLYMHSCP